MPSVGNQVNVAHSINNLCHRRHTRHPSHPKCTLNNGRAKLTIYRQDVCITYKDSCAMTSKTSACRSTPPPHTHTQTQTHRQKRARRVKLDLRGGQRTIVCEDIRAPPPPPGPPPPPPTPLAATTTPAPPQRSSHPRGGAVPISDSGCRGGGSGRQLSAPRLRAADADGTAGVADGAAQAAARTAAPCNTSLGTLPAGRSMTSSDSSRGGSSFSAAAAAAALPSTGLPRAARPPQQVRPPSPPPAAPARVASASAAFSSART
eukprot:85250-Chlamydomonas_euryale.AAC.4